MGHILHTKQYKDSLNILSSFISFGTVIYWKLSYVGVCSTHQGRTTLDYDPCFITLVCTCLKARLFHYKSKIIYILVWQATKLDFLNHFLGFLIVFCLAKNYLRQNGNRSDYNYFALLALLIFYYLFFVIPKT